MQTRIVAVRTAVIAGLDTLVALNGIDVTLQWKAGSKKRERIFTNRPRFTHTPAAMRAGQNIRDEVGDFDLVILVEGVGKTQEWTSNRAADLSLIVEDWVAARKNNELGVPGLQTLTISGFGELAEMFNDRGHLAELTLPVRYTARLT